uniref:Isolate 3 chitinase mRNA n=1 Tax=Nilaparvata lugens TaxID=108931 RepID=A0A0C5C9J3_NILLU|nr:chitinase [Nilaparvata lugens]
MQERQREARRGKEMQEWQREARSGKVRQGVARRGKEIHDGNSETNLSGCPGLRPVKRIVCYLEVRGSVIPPMDPCYCTHLILTTPLAKLGSDSEVITTLSLMRKRNPSLQVMGLASDAAETVLKRRDAYVKALMSVVRKTGLDGVELDLSWFTKISRKDKFYELVKSLYKEMKHLHDQSNSNGINNNRKKRDSEQNRASRYRSSETEEEDLEMTGSDEEEYVTEKVLKEPQVNSENNEEEKGENAAEENDDVSEEIGNYVISVRLPNEPQYLAKNFDLKRLSKYVNFFTISSENVTDASETGMTYHPSRLMGIEDILNSDSLVDLITGLGAPHPKLVLSLPGFALRFTLSDPNKNMPLSPVTNKPRRISQAEVCALMSEGKWTLERDEDLTAPYAYSNDTWLAFDDKISASIKGKYILLRDLGGAAIVNLDYIDWSGKCGKRIQQSEDSHQGRSSNDTITSAMAILPALFDSFTNTARKSRAAQLISLQEELHQFSPYSFSADVQLSPYRIVRVIDRAGDIHVVRKEAKTEFECSRQGYFRHPSGCNRFYRCVKFNQYSPDYTVFEYDCPAGLAFDEKYEVCVWPGSLEDGGACQGSSEIAPVPRERYVCPRVEGYYADPENCRWFFACMDHTRDGVSPLTAYEFRCPFGLVFNEQLLLCDWPWNVPSCGGAGSFRARFTVGDLLEGRGRASYATLPDYHVSGGRIENAGGVVLGSSIIPGVVQGGAYHGAGAFSSDGGLKHAFGAGDHHGGAYFGYGAAGSSLGSAEYAKLGGVHGGSAYEAGGAAKGVYSGLQEQGKYSGGYGFYGGAQHEDGKYSEGSAFEGANGVSGFAHGSDSQFGSGASAGHGIAYGSGGQFGAAGIGSGSGHGIAYGSGGQFGAAGIGSGSGHGIAYGSGGQFGAAGIGSGSGHGIAYGSGGQFGAAGIGSGSGHGIAYGSGGQFGAAGIGSGSGHEVAYGSGSQFGAAGIGSGSGHGVAYGSGSQFGAAGIGSGSGHGVAYGSGSQFGAAGIRSGSEHGLAYGSGSQFGAAAIGSGASSGHGIAYGSGSQFGAIGSGANVEGVNVLTSSSHSQSGDGAYYGAGAGQYKTGYSAGAGSYSQKDASHFGAAGFGSGLSHGAGSFDSKKAFVGGIVSSTPVVPVVSPVVTHDGSSSYEHEGALLEHHELGAGHFSSTLPPTSIVTESHVPISPITVSTPAPPVQPVQYFGSHISSGVAHKAPVTFVSTTPAPATIAHGYAPSIHAHEEGEYHAVTLPPLKPVSFLSGVSYRKPVIPLQSTVAPPLLPVSSPGPVKLNYYPQVQPVSSVAYKEHHEGYQYAKPVVHVSSPAPPLSVYSVSSPAPPLIPAHSPEYLSLSTPAPSVLVDHPKPVIPLVSSTPKPALFSVSTPAPPLKFNYPQPALPEIRTKEEYGSYEYVKPGFQVSSIAPPAVPVSTFAPPQKLAYYPRPQPVIPLNHKPEGESYIHSRPVPSPISVSTPAPLVSLSTPAPTVAPVNYAYYPKPQPVIPINHKPESESYVYSRPTVTVSTTPAPSVLPLVSTPETYHQEYSYQDHGYQYAKPAIAFSYPKPQVDLFKSIVKVPVAPVTPSPPPPLIVSSTPAYNSVKFGYEHRPFAFKSSTVAVSSTPVPPPSVVHYPTPIIPIEHQNVEVGYTFAKQEGYHYPKPVVSLPAPAPTPIVHNVDYSFAKEGGYQYSKPAVALHPPSFAHEEHYYQPPAPQPINYKFVSTTPAAPVDVTYEKKLIPAVPQPIEHTYREKAFSYNNVGYAYHPPSLAPAVIKTAVPVSLPPKNYFDVAPVSAVKFGVAYQQPVGVPVVSSTPAPPPAPVVHYSTPAPVVYYSTPAPVVHYPPSAPVVHYSTPAPSVKPIVVDYSYSHPKPVPSVLPPIHVTSTPLPPLNPVQYTYNKPVVPVSYHTAPTYPKFVSTTPAPPPVVPVSYQTPTYPKFVSSTPAPPPVISYSTTVAPPPPSPIVPVVSKAPAFPVDFIPQPPQTYLPSVHKYATPAPFKPVGFTSLGPKYKLVDSSTPLPLPVAPVKPVGFGYAYNKPDYYPSPAPVHVNAPVVTHFQSSTPATPVYIKTQTVVPAAPLPTPTPIVPVYQKVFDAFKAPVVTAYEKVLNVLKTSTPAAQPVYVNHYTSSTPLPPPVAVSTIKPVVPHQFQFGEIQGGYKYEGENLYESLKNEYGSKLSTYEGGYDYPKPAVKFESNVYNVKQVGGIAYSTTPHPPTFVPKKVFTPSTSAPPAYVDYNDYNSFAGEKYEHESGQAFYSSTPSTPVFKPTVQQFLKEVVYSKPTISTADYGHGDLHFYGTPSTTTILPPVTTARVHLPVLKGPVGGCIDCGISKSQSLKVKQPIVPVSYTTTTPVPLVVSTPLIPSTPLIHSRLPTTVTTPALHFEEHVEEALDVANEEEEEGANILAGYQQSGQFGGVISQSVGVKGVTTAQGVVGLSSTTVSSLRDGEAIVGVIKKEKNVYTGRQDKAKVVVVSRLSDFNPILVGKLGAECSCKSDPLSLRRRGKAKFNQVTKQYELFVPNDGQSLAYDPSYSSTTLSTPLAPIIVPDTLSNGEYGYSSNKHEEVSSFVEIKPQIHNTIRTTISPGPSFIPSSSPAPIYSSSVSYIEEPVSSTIGYEEVVPSVVPLLKTKKVVSGVRSKPVYGKSYQPTYQEILVPTIPAQTIADLDGEAKVIPGKSFDRYGPGGLRGADETLQGSVDCKRAGLFRHPKYCNKFYACNWDSWKKRFTLHVFNCPVHLAYDQQLGACNWPSKGPACSDDNLLV